MTIRSIILGVFLMTGLFLPVNATLTPLITKEQIADKVEEVARQLESDYQDKDLVVLMVMKGSICLASDLIRKVQCPLDLQFIQCSSYGAQGTVRGELKIAGMGRLDIQDRDVLIVDDIFDTGHTVSELIKKLGELSPRSIKSCVLLNKSGVAKATDYVPEYVLFDIEDHFVVGYGLDYKEQYRGFPGVYVLAP